MSDHVPASGAVLELVEVKPRRGVFGFGGGVAPVPRPAPRRALLLQSAEDPRSVRDVTHLAGREMPCAGPARLIQVNLEPFEARLGFAAVARDAEGLPWELLALPRLRVADPARLVAAGAPLPSPGRPVSAEALAEWWQALTAPRLADLLSTRDATHWADPAAAPLPLWMDLFKQLGAPESLEVELPAAPTLGSAARERAEGQARALQAAEQQARLEREREEQARLAAKKRAREAAELEELRRRSEEEVALQRQLGERRRQDSILADQAREDELAEALTESTLRRMDLDKQIALKEREIKLLGQEDQLAGEEFRSKLAETRRNRELAELEHESKKAELEQRQAQKAIAFAHQREQLRSDREKLQADQEAWNAERARQSTEAALHAEALAKLLEQIQAAVAAKQPPSRNEAAGWAAAASNLGLSPLALADLAPLGAAAFAETLRGWSESQRERVEIQLRTPLTRDFAAVNFQGAPSWLPDGVQVPLKANRIGERLSFEITSPRPGHLTLINGGSSGRYWLMAPMAGLGAVQVEGGKPHIVPGPGFPRELDIVQQGPEGMDYLIAIVSPNPVATPAVLDHAIAHPGVHFRELTPMAIQRLTQELERDPGAWRCGVVRFLVVHS